MNNNDLVSVIMSTYNNEKSIESSVNSILNQTYKNIEFLIIDDFSTDNTFGILNNLKNSDERIKVYRNSNNIGLTKSLNKLISKSKGTYIARQDADDISLTFRIQKQVNFLKEKKLDAVCSRALTLQENRKIPRLTYYIPIKFVMRFKNPFIHGTLLIKTDIIHKVGYDELFYYSQDYKLMSDLISSNFKIKIIKTPLYILNTKNNISTKFKKEQQYYSNCVKKKIKPINA